MQETRDWTLEPLRRAVAERLANGQANGQAGGTDVLVGLLGRAIQSSRSPAMHEREASRLGFSCSYLLVDFDALALPDQALGAAIKAAPALGFAGCNVTHPFKQQVLGHLQGLSPEAQAIGAVNTIVFSPHGAIGHNTDAWGFLQSFREGLPGAALGRVAQFGAGGAGAAVAQALLELGAREIRLRDPDRARAAALANRLNAGGRGRVIVVDDPAAAIAGADGIVNATPVGMAKYPGLPFAAELLRPAHWVAEIVYFPLETELLRAARALGCRTLSGIGMAIGQAARAFELFTGKTADRTAMAQFFEAA
ncbi:MAG: shikimate dehydrogenase [Reyranellaceae bacterium]